jgi:carboxyl-terminal processing protease
MRKSVLLFVLTFTTSCGSNQQHGGLNGVWKSIGYGKILEIKDDKYCIYEITRISCLPARQSTLIELEDFIDLRNDTLLLRYGTLTYSFTRLGSLPNACSEKISPITQNDILFNFEVFANTMGEHFAYFDLNKKNWDSLYVAQKSKLNSNSTATNLYAVLNETLKLTRDNHGQVEPIGDVIEKPGLVNTKNESGEDLKEYGDFEIAQIVAENFLDKDLTHDSKMIKWGLANKNIGYVQIKAMWLFADIKLSDSLIEKEGWVNAYASEMTKMNESEYISLEVAGVRRVMDRVMSDLFETDAIILDVRFNGGGQDAVSLEILRRFNDQKEKVVTQKAKFETSFTPEQAIILDSDTRPYIKPVFVLTSRQSASATDLFAMATLPMENVKRIGSRTNGAISTALERRLPNGWSFSISNEIYFDNNGVCYENIGVPVNHEMNYPEDRQAFFRWVADNHALDKQNILRLITDTMKSR